MDKYKTHFQLIFGSQLLLGSLSAFLGMVEGLALIVLIQASLCLMALSLLPKKKAD